MNLSTVLITILHWSSKAVTWFAMASGLVTIVNLVISSTLIVFNISVLQDIFGILQLWLPFNLLAILNWFVTASTAYFVYKLAQVANNLIDNWFVGRYNNG